MSKKMKKGSKKRSYEEFDLVDEPVAKPQRKIVVSSDDDADLEARPGDLEIAGGSARAGNPPPTDVADTPHYPCEGCQKQLSREVDAKLQACTLPVKTIDILNMLPHFTADELVATIVDMYSPSAVAPPIMSPARVAIADDDDKWRVLKFPDINFFSGTSFEKTIQSWMIPKLPVLYHNTHGIVGCALCKLQSVGSNSPVRSFCSALRFHICFSLRLTLACTGHAVVPRSWSICQRGRGEIQRLFCHYQQTTC